MGTITFSAMTLVDTDILIDASRQIDEALACLQLLGQHSCLTVSAITAMELLVGCRDKRELQITERFLERFHVVPLNTDITSIALSLLKQYRLSLGLFVYSESSKHVNRCF
jgi:hypothetical protein